MSLATVERTPPPSRPVRRIIRAGARAASTAGAAPGFTQGNIAIPPAANAAELTRFRELNQHACPSPTRRG